MLLRSDECVIVVVELLESLAESLQIVERLLCYQLRGDVLPVEIGGAGDSEQSLSFFRVVHSEYREPPGRA